MMEVIPRPARRLAAAVILGAAAWSCSSPGAAPPASRAPELWGDLKPVVSVKELMRDMLDPASDYVFDAVGITLTLQGTIEKSPKTDAEWERIRVGGVKLPRPRISPRGNGIS